MPDAVQGDDPIALARRVVDAVNGGEEDLLRGLLADDVEIDTGRRVRRGPDAVVAWAHKLFDHLDRRYAIEDFHPGPASASAVGVGTVDYVWREEGLIGDSSPIALELSFADGELTRIVVHDDPRTALSHLP